MQLRGRMPGGHTTAVLDSKAIGRIAPAEWDRLAASALCDNPYYSRQHLLGALETIDRGRAVSALAIRCAEGRLRALLPFRVRRPAAFPWRVADAAHNIYQSSSAPLVDAETAPAALRSWLSTLGKDSQPAFWTLADLDADSALARLIAEAAAETGRELHAVATYRRPRLTRLAGGLDAHLASGIAPGRLKRLRRNLRRLQQAGDVAFERAHEPHALQSRLEQFLSLEHAGWKGRRGTSLLADARSAAFARRAYGGAEDREGLAFIDSLLVDGRPIAMAINIASGRTVYSPKATYDEAWRSYGPGLLLDYLAIERFYADDRFDAFDAATTVDGHVLDDLWNDRRPMARLVIGPADWRTGALAGALERMHRLRKTARQSFGAAANVSQPLARLKRWVSGSLAATWVSACIALPELMLGIKRHEWVVAPITGAI